MLPCLPDWANRLFLSGFLDLFVGMILPHDFVFFLYNRMMSTELFVFENFLLHCITARHVGRAASLSPGGPWRTKEDDTIDFSHAPSIVL